MEKGKKKRITKTEIPIAPEFVGESFANFSGGGPNRIVGPGLGLNSIYLKFPNLYGYCLPYQYGQNQTIIISDAVLLCQKAYARVGVFRSSIDTFVELACSVPLYLDDGNAESVAFFGAWLKRINAERLRNQFSRELLRSGNIFLYRIDGTMSQDGARKLKQLYAKAANINIPLRYILLNPVNIAIMGALNFDVPTYYRLLNRFELNLLKNSPDADSKEVYKNIPQAMKGYFNGDVSQPIKIDSSKLHTIFYQKQDYEPFATPLGFSILDSLELKLAMQKCDAVVARTVEYIILLITMGADKEKGGTNPESLRLLKEVFKQEEIGRILVSDYTTKADFIIPDLNKVFGKAKYEAVNQDIADGLQNIFFDTSSRSSNLLGKLKIYSEKVNNLNQIFINEFLTPEVKRISKLMGFKSYPSIGVGRIDLDDTSQLLRIYTQLLQLGVLTPKDGLEAIERGILPEYEDLHQNQVDLKTDKDKGLFQPLMGGPFNQLQIAKLNQKGAMDLQQGAQDHQVTQTKLIQQHEIKQTKLQQQHEIANPKPEPAQIHLALPNAPKIANPSNAPKAKNPTGRPPGAKGSVSMAKLVENSKIHGKLLNQVELEYKKLNKIKKLKREDEEQIQTLARLILESEAPENWINKVNDYIENPIQPNQDVVLEIESLAQEYGLSSEAAAILYHSFIE